MHCEKPANNWRTGAQARDKPTNKRTLSQYAGKRLNNVALKSIHKILQRYITLILQPHRDEDAKASTPPENDARPIDNAPC